MGDEAKKKKVTANELEITQESSNAATPAFPDVCKTPSPGGPVPIPYPNIAKSSDTAKGTKKVKADGNEISLKNSSYKKSSGDEPSTTEGSEWKKAGSPMHTIIGFVKRRPVLSGVTILVAVAIIWVLLSQVLYTPTPYEPEEPLLTLENFILAM